MAKILAFAEVRDGRLRGVAGEVMSAAAEAAERLGGEAHAVVIGGAGASGVAPSLASWGASVVHVAEGPEGGRYQPESWARTLADLVLAAGGIRRVVYSEAETLPPLLEELIATRDVDPPMLVDVSSALKKGCGCLGERLAQQDQDASADLAPKGSYRREVHRDSLMLDDSLFVLRKSDVMVLEGVGPAVWLGADDSSEEELRDAALEQLPEPPEGVDPALVVSAAIKDLLDAGLLVQQA